MKIFIAVMLTLVWTVYVTALNAKTIDKRDCQNWEDVATAYRIGPENLLQGASIVEIPDPFSTNQDITDCYIKLPAGNLFDSAPDGVILFYNPTVGLSWFNQPDASQSLEFSPFIVLNTADDSVYPIIGIAVPLSLPFPKQSITYRLGSRDLQNLTYRDSWSYLNGKRTNFTQDAVNMLRQVEDWLVSEQDVKIDIYITEGYTFVLQEPQLQDWVSVLHVATSNNYAELLGGEIIFGNSDAVLSEGQSVNSDLACLEVDQVVESWYGLFDSEELIEIPNPHLAGSDCYFRGIDGTSVFLLPTAAFATDYTKGKISIFLEAFGKSPQKLKTGFFINTISGVEVPPSTRVYYTIGQNPPVRAFENFEFAYNESDDNYQIGMEYRNSDYLGILTEINNAYLEYQYVNPETIPEVTFIIGPAGRYGSITLTEGELRAWTTIETIVKQENDAKSYRQRKYAKWLNAQWFTPPAPDL